MRRRMEKGFYQMKSKLWKLRDAFLAEDGIGTVEMILILVVLIALVLIFKSKLTSLVNDIFDKITKQSNMV